MVIKNTISYRYSPGENSLVVLDKGKMVGGFVGEQAHKVFYELLETDAHIEIGGSGKTGDGSRKSESENQIGMEKSIKIRRLRALWIKQGCDEYREAILEPFGVTSTKDLTEAQLEQLIKTFSHDRKSDAPLEVRNARSVVLKLLMELGVYDNMGDWTKVNQFLMDKRIAGKLLFQMELGELKALTAKLRAILAKDIEQKREIRRKINQN